MVVKYYRDSELSYAGRKRYKNLGFAHFNEEVQKSILLGDGAKTQIKTSKNNICDYVTIDGTRWFVTSYVYQNGGQVTLNLQRDVIGEFGVDNCFGKIERGYTDTFLKNRKELGLNQILKSRKKVISDTNNYGNFSVNTHEKELWGILYLTKPNDGSSQININIPAFNPDVVDYPFITNGTEICIGNKRQPGICFALLFENTNYSYQVNIYYSRENENWVDNIIINRISTLKCDVKLRVNNPNSDIPFTSNEYSRLATLFARCLSEAIRNGWNNNFVLPANVSNIVKDFVDYDGKIIKYEDKFYQYTTEQVTRETVGGKSPVDKISFYNNVIKEIANGFKFYFHRDGGGENYVEFVIYEPSELNTLYYSASLEQVYKKYSALEISPDEAGTAVIDASQQLVDEPFIVVVCPLFDVTITDTSSNRTNIVRSKAFNIFNTIIQSLSGENGYIVDAQIYPYAPVLTKASFTIKGLPFYNIQSTAYTTFCSVSLFPSVDIKKEYIERSYSIVSPEQSGKFNFNFYDYKTKVTESVALEGKNTETIKIEVKTALKPFSIISSAVVIPDNDSLIGISYESDLRGCQPSGNGFQCSLSSNAFETYKRQNSNFQQIFALQKQELELSHRTERVNEKTNSVVSTITATAMGAMAGAASADGFWGNLVHSKGIGAAVGGTVAGSLVGVSQARQIAQNDELRQFEERLQQQTFDLEIGTIKNLPNSVNRISSFNEIILKEFYYIVETYECSEQEKIIVDNFISKYSYGIGVFDFISTYTKNGWFIRSTLVSSPFVTNLHNIASNELMGGIYIYE